MSCVIVNIIRPKYLQCHTQLQHITVIVIKEGIEVEHTDSKSIAVKSANVLLDECKSNANRALKNKDNKDQDAQQILDQLTSCVQKGVAAEIEKANEE